MLCVYVCAFVCERQCVVPACVVALCLLLLRFLPSVTMLIDAPTHLCDSAPPALAPEHTRTYTHTHTHTHKYAYTHTFPDPLWCTVCLLWALLSATVSLACAPEHGTISCWHPPTYTRTHTRTHTHAHTHTHTHLSPFLLLKPGTLQRCVSVFVQGLLP